MTPRPPIRSAACKRSVAWGEAREDEWQTVPTRRAAPRSVWEECYPSTRNRFSPLDDGDETGATGDEYGMGCLPQPTAESTRRGKPARAKKRKAGKEPMPQVLVLDGLPGVVSTRVAVEKTGTSAPRMQRRLRPRQCLQAATVR